DDHSDLAAHELRRQRRQPIVVALGPTVFGNEVLALNVAGAAQTIAERCKETGKGRGRTRTEVTNHPHCRLLRARRERPSGYTASEKRDEFPSPHGAYPKAKDQGRSIAGLAVVSGTYRNKKRRLALNGGARTSRLPSAPE